MGYKLAGFDVIGCNEIDPKMMKAYKINHNPVYAFQEPIQTFVGRQNLPQELYNLDILDGSPPCSSFSMAGNRSADWGKDKVFREGQAEQVLDTLFFDFISLAKRLKPKVVIAENVKGLLLGEARNYVRRIYKEFDEAGYYCQHWLLDASKMGVPQRRERIFFICLRKDLADPFLYQQDMFTVNPKLYLEFKEPEIPFSEIQDINDLSTKSNTEVSKYYDLVEYGQSFATKHPKGHFFGDYKANPDEPLNTICADPNHGGWHHSIKRMINFKEVVLGGSFPQDYNFKENNPKYLVGMSVPPVMTAQIAKQVYDQWLSKITQPPLL